MFKEIYVDYVKCVIKKVNNTKLVYDKYKINIITYYVNVTFKSIDVNFTYIVNLHRKGPEQEIHKFYFQDNLKRSIRKRVKKYFINERNHVEDALYFELHKKFKYFDIDIPFFMLGML